MMEEVTNGSLNGLMDNHLTSVTVKLKIFLLIAGAFKKKKGFFFLCYSTNGESMRVSEITTHDDDNEILSSYDNEYYQQNELNWLRAITNRQKAKIEELNEGRKMLSIELAQLKDIMLVDIYSANNSYTMVLSTTY
ncbi:unnamed protein product [Brugia pahangi]|uniref:Ribonuclease H-like domain-containing protein n=1 Tax=Brugia pahangi TaxID=6280 RepID=A0A0N4TVF3_BRUPA|nr:unnamed protein product [Brugia pahangi]